MWEHLQYVAKSSVASKPIWKATFLLPITKLSFLSEVCGKANQNSSDMFECFIFQTWNDKHWTILRRIEKKMFLFVDWRRQ